MNTPHFISTIGSTTGALAKRVGSGTVGIAQFAGDGATSLAKGTANLAKKVGPKRGLIGLVAVGALVGGGIVLARYLKRRRFEQESMEASDSEQPMRDRKRAKNGKQQRAQEATTL
jgi:hypothetical protein